MEVKTQSSLDNPIKSFLKDSRLLLAMPTPKKFMSLVLPEFAFDLQLLNLSPLYRHSRELYLELGGRFFPRLCSTMRGLSTQDLFKDEIDYAPGLPELTWFVKKGHIYSDSKDEISALIRFSEISLFHEQNHRVIWRLLPPVPTEKADVCRYLNFAEALVVTLDMAMSDQLSFKISTTLERLKSIYHPGCVDKYSRERGKDYRNYLLAILTTTYYAMETMHPDDVLNAVNFVLPGQKTINRAAVNRGLDLSQLFTCVTNPQWQKLNWKSGQVKLGQLQKKSKEAPLHLPKDPLDLDGELKIADRVFDHFGI